VKYVFAIITTNEINVHTVPLYEPPTLDVNESSTGLVDKFIPRISEHSNHGFTIVGNSSRDTSSASHQLRVNTGLMDIVSERTEIDHPLCEVCCDTLITLLDVEVRAAEEERIQYIEFLKRSFSFISFHCSLSLMLVTRKGSMSLNVKL